MYSSVAAITYQYITRFFFFRLNLVFWTNMDVGEINQARLSDGGQIRTIVSGLESPGK